MTRSGSPKSFHSTSPSRSVSSRLAPSDRTCREKSAGSIRSYSRSTIRFSPSEVENTGTERSACNKAGTDAKARSRKALMWPTITKVFHKEPLLSRCSAIGSGGFSWKLMT